MISHKKPEIHARLPRQQFDTLVSHADAMGINISELVRLIIARHFETPSNPVQNLSVDGIDTQQDVIYIPFDNESQDSIETEFYRETFGHSVHDEATAVEEDGFIEW